MADFTVHTPQSAPDAAADTLRRAESTFGMLPNMMGVMAQAPTTAKAYLDLHDAFASSSLTPIEQQVVALAVSRQHECEYCMAAETVVASSVGANEDLIEALRDGGTLPDERLEALRQLTRTIVEKRAWIDDQAVEDFIAAGFEKGQVLEVVLGVTKKTLSNYTNHIGETPLDEGLREHAWTQPESAAVGA